MTEIGTRLSNSVCSFPCSHPISLHLGINSIPCGSTLFVEELADSCCSNNGNFFRLTCSTIDYYFVPAVKPATIDVRQPQPWREHAASLRPDTLCFSFIVFFQGSTPTAIQEWLDHGIPTPWEGTVYDKVPVP